MKGLKLFGTLLTAAFVAVAGTAQAQKVVVGGKNFTEQLILAEMTARYLEANGFDVDKRDGMGSTVLRRAQLNAQVDLYWEYVGTSLITYNKVEGGAKLSPEAAYEKVKELDVEKGLVWLKPSDANNTYALAMRNEEARKRGIDTISDLVKALENGEQLDLAIGAEFSGRPDGLPGLEDHYGFRYPRSLLNKMDPGLTYQALKQGNADVSMVFATDGRIAAFNFDVLADDKGFFPNYALTPVVRKDTLDEHPRLRDLLNKLSASLDAETLRRLNKSVDVDKKPIEKVARQFLEQQGLV